MPENVLQLTAKGKICESLLDGVDSILAIDLQCSHSMELGVYYA